MELSSSTKPQESAAAGTFSDREISSAFSFTSPSASASLSVNVGSLTRSSVSSSFSYNIESINTFLQEPYFSKKLGHHTSFDELLFLFLAASLAAATASAMAPSASSSGAYNDIDPLRAILLIGRGSSGSIGPLRMEVHSCTISVRRGGFAPRSSSTTL